MLDAQQREHPSWQVQQVITAQQLLDAQRAVKEIYVDRLIKEYIVSIVEATRRLPDVYLGASPRGSSTQSTIFGTSSQTIRGSRISPECCVGM